MDMTYRDFEESDFGDLSEMVFCLYEEDPEGQKINDAKIRKTVDEYTARPEKLRIVIICADGKAVGYSLIVFCWSNEYGGDIVIIDELFVKKEYRNNRVASDFIENQIREYKNAAAVEIEATPSNSEAKRLYERLGFEVSQNDRYVFAPINLL